MFIKLIFYIIEVIEFIRSMIFEKILSESRLFSIVKNEIDLFEQKLKKLTFISLILGVAILFYTFKLTMRLLTSLLKNRLSPKSEGKILAVQREINKDDIQQIMKFQKFENIELEFKNEGQEKNDVIRKFVQL